MISKILNMTRVKRGTLAHKKRERLLRYTKGFRWSRKTKERAAKEALLHAWSHSFRGRKKKKRDFRGLWQIKINAALRSFGATQDKQVNYSKFINLLKKANIKLDRKILADLAENEPRVLEWLIKEVSTAGT